MSSPQLATVLSTSTALIAQFQDTLAQSTQPTQSTQSPNDVKALPLLSASCSTLKAQVTKLSLLAITTPFTHSALVTVLRACNESVLPSLLTATLLVNPAEYTNAFHSESLLLTKTTLTEFSQLVTLVKNVADKKDQAKKGSPKAKENELSKAEKNTVTLATGRVWDACDAVVNMATNGVIGFIARRVEQWRDLVRDAVEELESWDPEDADDDFFDDIMGDNSDSEGENSKSDEDSENDKDFAALQEHKKATLRFLKPVIQVYTAIVKNRLNSSQESHLTSSAIARLEKLTKHLQSIPGQVDEAAGTLYEDDVDSSVDFLNKIQYSASEAMNVAVSLWISDKAEVQTSDDKFVVWSKTWSKVMHEVSKPFQLDAAGGEE
ncbi:uncharacterized protein N7483_009303 [Penicillium malachiteum]|uniref:uncharacterized protein n=1 Tax=Penicillium malachiteum TaxID=1324776 RepID=UPI0025473353|nr:uncharacterized protein N7483_009303 [Penicillium malachiteum]KAJ5721369.1 hypothetical protein N7483_009303 [Penicillium malachiteum]